MEDPKEKRNLDAESFVWVTPYSNKKRCEEYRFEYKPLVNHELYEIRSSLPIGNPEFLEAFSRIYNPEKITALNGGTRTEKVVLDLRSFEHHILLNTTKEQRKAIRAQRAMFNVTDEKEGIQSARRRLEQAKSFIEKNKNNLHQYAGKDGVVNFTQPNEKIQIEAKGTISFALNNCEQNLKRLENNFDEKLMQVDQKINDISANKSDLSKNVKKFGIFSSVFLSGVGCGGFFSWIYSKYRS